MSRRVLKVAEAIREVVAMAILTDLRDPRVENVTVTFVEVSRDLRHAKVHVSIMLDDEAKQRRCLNALQNAAGYLQQKVNNRVDLRYTPVLKFVLDQGVKNSFAVTRILEEVLPAERANEAPEDSAQNGPSIPESQTESENPHEKSLPEDGQEE